MQLEGAPHTHTHTYRVTSQGSGAEVGKVSDEFSVLTGERWDPGWQLSRL